jgi:methylated-DNA-[protein]-cysteine S-methyltransferase
MKYDINMVYNELKSTQGPVYMAATERGLAGMWFTDQRHLPDVSSWKRCDDATTSPTIIQEAFKQLQAYFAGKLQQFDLPLDLSAGTAFQQSVWQAILAIPYGKTATYSAVSRALGNPLAIRAVGTATGRNPIGIVVPCHRVMGADGSLTGYAGGLHRKEAFLKLEGALPTHCAGKQAVLL